MPSPRSEFLAGFRAELPILVGVAPFGMIYGVLALSAGLTPGVAQAMSWVVFAGSAQFIIVQLIGVSAPAWVIMVTAFVVNLRHALYSASVAPYVHHLPRRWKLLLSYLLTDEAYAVAIIHYATLTPNPSPMHSSDLHGRGEGVRDDHWYFLGAGLALWGSWQLSTAVGVFLGAQVPPSWSLDFTLALTFIALVVPNLKDRPSLAASLSAGVTALVAYGLPYKLGLIVAALVGILVGLWSEQKMENVWIALILAGLLTFLIRLSFIALWGRWTPPRWLSLALKYVPPAVLTAIIFPEILIRQGQFSPLNPRLLAGVIAALVAWRTKNVILTIVVGMGVLLGLQFFTF